MGRQYVRQSFSSASCAAGDSPCASRTTLQCVVANATAPPLACRWHSVKPPHHQQARCDSSKKPRENQACVETNLTLPRWRSCCFLQCIANRRWSQKTLILGSLICAAADVT